MCSLWACLAGVSNSLYSWKPCRWMSGRIMCKSPPTCRWTNWSSPSSPLLYIGAGNHNRQGLSAGRPDARCYYRPTVHVSLRESFPMALLPTVWWQQDKVLDSWKEKQTAVCILSAVLHFQRKTGGQFLVPDFHRGWTDWDSKVRHPLPCKYAAHLNVTRESQRTENTLPSHWA